MNRNLALFAVLGLSGILHGQTLPDIRDAYGVAIADFNGDGLQDVYVVGFRTLNRMLINQGNGVFRDRSISSRTGGNLMPQGIRNLELGATAVDYDNDGAVDLLVAGWGDALELLHNRGDGTFEDVTRQTGILRDADANMAVFADLDRDGYPDLLLTNEHGPMRLYRNDHGIRFVPVPLEEAGLISDSGSQGAVFTDLNGDGNLDLAVAGWRDPMRVYEQTSAFRFREVALPLKLPPGTQCNNVTAADFDNDGDMDLLFTRREGRSDLLQNQSNPTLTAPSPKEWKPATAFPEFREVGESWGLPDSTDAYAAVAADFNGDGRLDVFLTGRGENHYLENEGGRFVELPLPHGGILDNNSDYSTAAIAADLTPAPGLELFVASRDSACALYQSRLTQKPLLHVFPKGLFSNRSAVGASVSLWRKQDTVWRMVSLREVHGGEGYLSSYSGPVLFAPPADGGEWRVRVAFPSGRILVRGIQPEQTDLEIWEGGFLAGVYVRVRDRMRVLAHDPVRARALVVLLLLVLLAIVFMRWAIRRAAASLARRKYLQEQEVKNRELERLIEELRRAQQQLVQSEKLAALGQLVAGIAHELNNPIGFIYANLHQIQGYLGTLASGSSTPEEREILLRKAREALEESREGSKRVRDIVQNLRGISGTGPASKSGLPEKKRNDLNQLLDKSLMLAQTTFSKSIEIEKEYAALPEVPCDSTQIQQVFLNILVNAGQAMGDAGKLRLRTWRDGGFACAGISDSGPGIAPEHAKHLFEPFFTTKPVGQGLGLGLHISYDIIRAHGGTLEARSEPGRGAEFIVRMPLDAHPSTLHFEPA